MIGSSPCFICYYLMYLYSSFSHHAQKFDISDLIFGNVHALEPLDLQVDLVFISFFFCCLYLCTLTSTTLHSLAALQLFIFFALLIITHLKFGVINFPEPNWTAACTCNSLVYMTYHFTRIMNQKQCSRIRTNNTTAFSILTFTNTSQFYNAELGWTSHGLVQCIIHEFKTIPHIKSPKFKEKPNLVFW